MPSIGDSLIDIKNQVINTCSKGYDATSDAVKKGYNFVSNEIGNLNRKVEKLAYDHLSPKIAQIALNTLKAIPFAGLMWALPGQTRIGFMLGVVGGSYLNAKVSHDALFYHMLDGTGLFFAGMSIKNITQAASSQEPRLAVIAAVIDLVIAGAYFSVARLCENEIQKKKTPPAPAPAPTPTPAPVTVALPMSTPESVSTK